jgi:hypothetical protein
MSHARVPELIGERGGATKRTRRVAACAYAGARPTRARSRCDRERSAPAAACSPRQGRAATPGRRACTAENATDSSSSCTRQCARAHATPGCSAVAATAAARPPCVAPTSPAATPVRAGACSRNTADAAPERGQPPSVRADHSCCTAGVGVGETSAAWCSVRDGGNLRRRDAPPGQRWEPRREIADALACSQTAVFNALHRMNGATAGVGAQDYAPRMRAGLPGRDACCAGPRRLPRR